MRHLLQQLLLPPAGPLLAAGLGLLLARRFRWGRRLAAVALGLAWLGASPGVVEPLARAYAQAPSADAVQRQVEQWRGRRDAVVLVLGGGIREASAADGRYDLKPLTAERLRRGLWWARQLDLPYAFSGGVPQVGRPDAPSEAAVLQAQVEQLGWPSPAWVDDQARDTRDNARFSAERLRANGTTRVLLVTHALHMPRALAHFRAAAPHLQVLPAPLQRDPTAGPWTLADWLPSADGAWTGHYLAYEVLARLVGH